MGKKVSGLFCLFLIFVCGVPGISADIHGSTKVKDEDKAYYIAQVLVDNLNLTKQLWSIGEAAASLGGSIHLPSASSGSGSGGPKLDQGTKNSIYNYILDSIPHLLMNDVFGNITQDMMDEFYIAYNKSNVSKNISAYKNDDGSISNEALKDVIKYLDVVRVLQRSIESGKPVIDDIRGNDSTVFIAVVNYMIGIAPVVWKDPSFQAIKEIVIEELTLGYNKFLEGKSFTGPEIAHVNSTILVMGVTKFTNIQRMLLRSMKAAKPVIDKIRGKDSTVLLMGLGFMAKEYPVFMADSRTQHVQSVMTKYFGDTFKSLNYTISDLQRNQTGVVKNVLAKTEKLHMLQDILRGGSARDLLPLTENDHVNNKCYNDSMDFLDGLVEMFPWALKSKCFFLSI